MPEPMPDRPKRKAMFLSPEALGNLRATASRRRTERQAMEEALELLAERDAQRDSMTAFVAWAHEQWGHPSADDRAAADKIWAER